jgi:hypothetical protein
MSTAKFLIPETGGLEPLAISIPQTSQITSESRSQVYDRIARGEYQAVKSGSRTLVIYESVKRRIASLPRARIKVTAPRRNPFAKNVKSENEE